MVAVATDLKTRIETIMDDKDGSGKKARRRGKPLEVWVTDEEKAVIAANAEQAGLSRSAYLRTLGLNHPVRSRVSLENVADLIKMNAQLAQIAELLKEASPQFRATFSNPNNLPKCLESLGVLQSEMRLLLSKIR